MKSLQKFVDRAYAIAQQQKWKKDWANGGCYLHLESSEFIEALRGKGESPPAEEAGDVLFALFTMMGYYKIPISEVLHHLDRKIKIFETPKKSEGDSDADV